MLSTAAAPTSCSTAAARSSRASSARLRDERNRNNLSGELGRNVNNYIPGGINPIAALPAHTADSAGASLTSGPAGITGTTTGHSVAAVATLAAGGTCSARSSIAAHAGHSFDDNLRCRPAYACRNLDRRRHTGQTIVTLGPCVTNRAGRAG
jgi:hypothetical protein